MNFFKVRVSESGHLIDKLDENNNILDTYLVYKDRKGHIHSTCENFKRYKYPHNYSHIRIVKKFIELGEPDYCLFWLDEDKKLKYYRI